MTNKQTHIHFRTSGYRSKIGRSLNPSIAVDIGASVISHLEESPIFIGYDNRRTSLALAQAAASGAMTQGAYVYIGAEAMPTPVAVNYIVHSDAKGGIMVTGSHLPPSDNGLIYLLGDGTYFKGKIPLVSPANSSWEVYGDSEFIEEPVFAYLDRIRQAKSDFDIYDPDRIVVLDTAHGPSIHYFRELMGGSSRSIVEINTTPNDEFPGRPSEPLPNHLISTQAIAEQTRATIGVATDMDGDRVVFIDENHHVLIGDFIGTLFAIHYWEKNPGKTVIAPINTSLVFEWAADNFNGQVAYTPIGPPSIIQGIKELDAKFAFEESGKYFFTEWGLWPDAMYSTIRMLHMLKEQEKLLGEFSKILPKTYLVKEKIKGSRSLFQKKSTQIKERLDQYLHPEEIISIDGHKLVFEDKSWVLVRPSGTENYIRIFSEAFEKSVAMERLNLAKQITKENLGK